MQDVKPKVNWDYVKEQIENGRAFRDICRELGAAGTPYSHQNLIKKARKHGWMPLQSASKPTPSLPAPVEPADLSTIRFRTLGLRTRDNLKQILAFMNEGATQHAACQAVGMSPSNFSHWKADQPKISQQVDAIRWRALGGTQRSIWKAGVERGDWRAAAHYLAKAPETKAEWGGEDQHSGGIRIEFKFERPMLTIDATAKS